MLVWPGAVFAVAFASGCAHGHLGESPRQEAVVLGMRVDGRYCLEAAAEGPFGPEPPSVRVAYPLTRLRYATDASDVAICAQDIPMAQAQNAGGRYRLRIDGVGWPDFTPPLTPGCVLIAKGLPKRRHEVELRKETEPEVSETRFWRPPAAAAPPPSARRRLLFVGDSITCGYGVRCSDPHEPFSPATEQASLSYPALLAERWAADVEVVAFSGRGVWRNRDQSGKGTLPDLFARALPHHAQPPRRPARADVVVINLGTNDFSHPAVDEAGFAQAFARLLALVHADSPKAPVLLVLGPMLSNQDPHHPQALNTARRLLEGIQQKQRAEQRIVEIVEVPPQNETPATKVGFGCDYHPNAAMHRLLADALNRAIAAHTRW